MSEGDGALYNDFKEQVLSGTINLASGGDTIKVGLLTGHSPDIDIHDQWTDVSGDEESGTGYTAGGATLGSKAVTQDNTNDLAKFDAADVQWSGLDVGTPSHAVMYDDTHAQKALIAYWEITTASNGGDYTLEWNTNGILTLA